MSSLEAQREVLMREVREVISEHGIHPNHLSRVVGWVTSEGRDVREGRPVTLGEYIAANAPEETIRAFGLERSTDSQTPIRRIDQLSTEEQQQVVVAEYQTASDDFTMNGLDKAAIIRSVEAGIVGNPFANGLISDLALIEDLADRGSLHPSQPEPPNF